MTIDIPNVVVAVENTSQCTWHIPYGGEIYVFEAGEITNVPFEIANRLGFEFDDHGQLYRNTADKYSDGEETQFYMTRSCMIPWLWNDPRLVDKQVPREKITYGEKFDILLESFNTGFKAKVHQAPKKISRKEYEAMPA